MKGKQGNKAARRKEQAAAERREAERQEQEALGVRMREANHRLRQATSEMVNLSRLITEAAAMDAPRIELLSEWRGATRRATDLRRALVGVHTVMLKLMEKSRVFGSKPIGLLPTDVVHVAMEMREAGIVTDGGEDREIAINNSRRRAGTHELK